MTSAGGGRPRLRGLILVNTAGPTARDDSAMNLPIAWITHPDCLRHDMGEEHPECPARLRAIEERLHEAGIWDFLAHHAAPEAPRAALQRVHDAAYVQRML
ncbi:MAG TPA: hypothetical protein VHE37_03910, partial [Nevskiaceae bacterium]|nr:hypothetical protein [Nevskiaceae bacterium]